jgi:hypothetical protein
VEAGPALVEIVALPMSETPVLVVSLSLNAIGLALIIGALVHNRLPSRQKRGTPTAEAQGDGT